MITQRGREQFADRACADFEAQDYPNKELIVVHDTKMRGLSLGALRNESVKKSNGEFIAIWDDDDWNHPQRLSRQLAQFRPGDKKVASFLGAAKLRCVCGAETVLARGWECTMIATREDLPRYFSVGKKEDSFLITLMSNERWEFRYLNEPELYTKLFHGSNAWGASHSRDHFARGTPPHVCERLIGQ